MAASLLGFLLWPRDQQVRAVLDPAQTGTTQPLTTSLPTTTPPTAGPTVEGAVPAPATSATLPGPQSSFDTNLSVPVGGEIPIMRLLGTWVLDRDLVDMRPNGSGCSAGDSTLPNGEWFGCIGIDSKDQLSIDLACHYNGSAAAASQIKAEEGRLADDWEDHYTVNHSLRTRPLATDSRTVIVDKDPVPSSTRWLRISEADLRQAILNPPESVHDRLTAWVLVQGGRIAWIETSAENYAG